MGSINEAESCIYLEALCKQDSSWYPCKVSLSSTEDSLIVDFGRHELEDMVLNKDEVLVNLRFRSGPLQGDDCSHIEGENVLVIHKSPFKSYLYDAKVEEVTRVRHSTRVYCRCSFVIKWLHPDFKGQMVTVTSSSILKLASKSISSHPTVAAFFKSVKQIGLYTAPLLPIMHEDVDVEFDLNKLLGKQIEEINSSVIGVTNKITVDILKVVEGDNNGHVTASKICTSKAQVSHDQDQMKSVINRSEKLEVNKEDEDPQPLFLSKPELYSEHRSHISPLGARAALASLVSLTHKNFATSGSELFKSSDSNHLPIKVSSDRARSPENEFANSGSDARTTCALGNKGLENQKSDVHNSSEAIKLTALTTRGRLTRSAVKEKENISSVRSMATKPGSIESKCAQITKSYSSEGANTVNGSKVSKKNNNVSQNAVCSPHHSESSCHKQGRTSSDLGAIQDACVQARTGAQDTTSSVSTNSRRLCVQARTGAQDTTSSVSTNSRRLTRSTSRVSCQDNMIGPESCALENANHETKRKKAVSVASQNVSMPGGDSNEEHNSEVVRNSRKTEGKMTGNGDNSQGQKRKPTSSSREEQRFSPRLRFLPRTRSQNKSYIK